MEQDPIGPSCNRPPQAPAMSSACLLFVEKLWPKNKFNQRSENAEAKKSSQTEQNNNSLVI